MKGLSALRASARPVVRDMFKTPWRLFAAVLLIASPVTVATAMTVDETSRSLSFESVSRPHTMHFGGGQCTQNGDGSSTSCTGSAGGRVPEAPASFSDYLDKHLPEGLTAQLDTNVLVSANTERGTISQLQVNQSPIELLPQSYRSRIKEGGIVLPISDANELGVEIGDTITVRAPVGTKQLTVTDISPSGMAAVAPGTLVEDAAQQFADKRVFSSLSEPSWVLGGRELHWPDVQKLNKAGFTVSASSKHPITDAPESPAPTHGAQSGSRRAEGILFGAMILSLYGIAIFLILLFIAPVFSLAMSRHTRMFALMSSQGASPRHIRLAVLSYAAATGALGASAGVVAGAGFTAVAWAINYPGWPITLAPWALLGYFVAAMAGSVLVAVVPALIASRNALAAGIAGAEPDRIVRWKKWMVAGPIYLAILLAVVVTASLAGTSSEWQPVFSTSPIMVLLSLPGLAASTPALIFLIAKALRRAPLPLRIASRGLFRKSVRTVPIAAALLCLTFVGSLTVVNEQAQARREAAMETYTTSSPMAVVAPYVSSQEVDLTDEALQKQTRSATEAVMRRLGAPRSYQIRGIVPNSGESNGIGAEVTPNYESRCSRTGDADSYNSALPNRFVGSNGKNAATDEQAAKDCYRDMVRLSSASPLTSLSHTALVQEPGDLGMWALDGRELALAERTLADGGILVPRATPLKKRHDGLGHISVTADFADIDGGNGTGENGENGADSGTQGERVTMGFTAAAVLPVPGVTSIIFSPQAAAALKLQPVTLGYAIPLDQAVSDREQSELSSLAKQTPGQFSNIITVSFNYGMSRGTSSLGTLIVIGFSAIAMMLVIILAAAGLRRDNATLLAIGGSPRLTASIAAIQAAMTTLIGMGSGVLLGHLMNFAFASKDEFSAAGDLLEVGTTQFTQPSWWLIAGVLGVTLLAAAVAWFIHRPGSTAPEVARRRD